MKRLLDFLDDMGTALKWGLPSGALILIAGYHVHLAMQMWKP